MPNIQQVSDILVELNQIYSDGKDENNLDEIRRLYDESRSLMNQRERHYQSLITELIDGTKTLSDAASEDASSQLYVKKQNALKEQCAAVQNSIQSLEDDLKSETVKLQKLEDSHQELTKEKELESSVALKEVPIVRSTLKLYSNITNIQWDYDSKNRVRGYCNMPACGDIRSFDMDANDTDVTDALWDMMWENYASAMPPMAT